MDIAPGEDLPQRPGAPSTRPRWWRGGLAGRINTPVSDTLQVVRSTRDQVELSAAERRRNVAGAFSAGGRARGRLLPVDDVFTLGTTTSACAAALLDAAGAAEVHAVTLCRMY